MNVKRWKQYFTVEWKILRRINTQTKFKVYSTNRT